MKRVAAIVLCAAFGVGAFAGPAGAAEGPSGARPGEPAPAPAAAPPADPYAGLPRVVATAVRELEAACRAEEGTLRWDPRTVYAVVEVSQDGRPDYLIDTHDLACDDGGYTPWIGSDGFRYIVFVSTGPDRWTRAFDRPARIFEIVAPKGGRPRIEVLSHAAHCTRPNPERYQRCEQTFEWRRGKLRKVHEEWFTG